MDLKELRTQIDAIDSQLTELFCRRMDVSEKIGEYKKENGLPVFDEMREKERTEAVRAGCPERYKDAVTALYKEIFRLSRDVQKKKCGLLGEKLSHSYSPLIHSKLADYKYVLYEKSREEVEKFLKSGDWDGLNVTIPYKKTVMQYCGEISERAKRIGSVNTLVKRPDGSIFGDNTDAFGFELLVKKLGVAAAGKKALILGSGGACAAVKAVLEELGVSELVVISRTGSDNYRNISRHYDAQIIVNTTPLGTYPNNGTAAVDLKPFTKCEAVIDLVYNPARTALVMQAEQLGIPCTGGLYMLTAQARRSSELFTGSKIEAGRIDEITAELRDSMENIVLIGMPGCGKTTVGKALSKLSGKKLYDTDELIEKEIGISIPEFFEKNGEQAFREIESRIISEISRLSGAIIATGGGAVTRRENYPLLHQNSRIVWLKRDLNLLPIDGRPVSKSRPAEELYSERRPLYEAFSDYEVNNSGSPEETAKAILEAVK